jgi:hypothetical protein
MASASQLCRYEYGIITEVSETAPFTRLHIELSRKGIVAYQAVVFTGDAFVTVIQRNALGGMAPD